MAGEGDDRRWLVTWRSGRTAVSSLWQLLPAAILLAVLLVLLSETGLRLTSGCMYYLPLHEQSDNQKLQMTFDLLNSDAKHRDRPLVADCSTGYKPLLLAADE